MFSPFEIGGRETGLFLFFHDTFPFQNDPSASRRTPQKLPPSDQFRTFRPVSKALISFATIWQVVIFIVFFHPPPRVKFADRIDNGATKVKPTLMPFQAGRPGVWEAKTPCKRITSRDVRYDQIRRAIAPRDGQGSISAGTPT